MTKNILPKILKSKTPKIYKNKKLNTANFGNFTLNDYQIFLHLVSKIGGVDELGKYLQPERLQREHILTAKEFSEVFDAGIDNSYKILRKAVDKLMKTDLKVERNESLELWRINVCSMAKYNKREGRITVKFTDDIMPYLAVYLKIITLLITTPSIFTFFFHLLRSIWLKFLRITLFWRLLLPVRLDNSACDK
jgi:plasmid replication initiation protein